MKSKIRVLHVIKSLGRGGAEMLLPETLKVHDKNQFEFHYIYFLPWKDQLVEELEQAGGKVQCFQANNNLQIIGHYKRLLTYIKVNNIDLVHCHLPWAGFVGRLLFRFKRIKVIYTEHNKQERYHRITYFLNKLTFNWQSIAIAVSEDVRESIQKNIRPSVKVLTLLNGVNTETFVRDVQQGRRLREEYAIPTDALVVGTIAVFRFQKRLEEWLEVAKVFADKNDKAFFIIVGDGPLKQQIINKRASLGLENKVLLAGLQSNVRPWLSAIDIYMMTSLYEGLPIALLEAMSMECAVVSTKAGGIVEVISHEENGLLTEIDNYISLANELEVLTDRNKRDYLANQARVQVAQHFSMERMIFELENLYKIVVANS